jgi:hypothetical protein
MGGNGNSAPEGGESSNLQSLPARKVYWPNRTNGCSASRAVGAVDGGAGRRSRLLDFSAHLENVAT